MRAVARWQNLYDDNVGSSAGALIGLATRGEEPDFGEFQSSGNGVARRNMPAAVRRRSCILETVLGHLGDSERSLGGTRRRGSSFGAAEDVQRSIVYANERTSPANAPAGSHISAAREDWLQPSSVSDSAKMTQAVLAFATRSHLHQALFGVGAAALVLLFVGIHNAWDAVTYHVFVKRQGQPEGE